jgi:transcriptional regulator with XRE-family HTH domain
LSMKDNLITDQLGKNIRELRLKMGLTQEELAELTQIHSVYVSNIETGLRNITVVKAFKIAQALNCDISDLFKGIPPSPKNTSK